jgi:hypothetical protein
LIDLFGRAAFEKNKTTIVEILEGHVDIEEIMRLKDACGQLIEYYVDRGKIPTHVGHVYPRLSFTPAHHSPLFSFNRTVLSFASSIAHHPPLPPSTRTLPLLSVTRTLPLLSVTRTLPLLSVTRTLPLLTATRSIPVANGHSINCRC